MKKLQIFRQYIFHKILTLVSVSCFLNIVSFHRIFFVYIVTFLSIIYLCGDCRLMYTGANEVGQMIQTINRCHYMEKVLEFLRELEQNNNKAWFDSHKKQYQQAKSAFSSLVLRLIEGVSAFDPTIKGLGVNDCTYRINKDMRFSKDKLPYKTHFGAFIARGGKKSGYSGYYFHIGTGSGDSFPCSHLLASGNYFTEPKVLKILREDIELGGGDFDDIVRNKVDGRMILDSSPALKKVPAGFPADSPYAEYLKLKNFCLSYYFDDALLLAPEMPETALEIFRSTKPFIDYINRAIDFSREESGSGLLEF